jgi:hypothetical protein
MSNQTGPTDFINNVGHWPYGWLNGEWKCPVCNLMIGKNLNGKIPFGLVSEHKTTCVRVKQLEPYTYKGWKITHYVVNGERFFANRDARIIRSTSRQEVERLIDERNN